MFTQRLEPLKNQNEKSPKFTVCDIETADWVKFLVIGLYDGKECKYFKKLDHFLDYMFLHCSDRPCFAHFGGKFDFSFIIREVLLRREKYFIGKMVPRGSGLLFVEVVNRKTKDKITFRDSSALLPFSLKRITENFGVKHTKQEIDYSRIKKVTKKLLEYLEYDLKGLYESLEAFYAWPLIRRAGPAHTIASQSLRAFRTYIKTPIYGLDPKLDTIIRKAYFGGRVEIFRFNYRASNQRPLFGYDCNSIYPYALRNNSFPHSFLYETYRLDRKYPGFYRATVGVPSSLKIPPLGVLRKDLDDYIYPTGEFKGFWTGAELEYAKTLGVKVEIENGWVFSHTGLIFREYVDDLYKIRENSKKDSVDNMLAKLLLNSLYGRFALRRDREVAVFDEGQTGVIPFDDDNDGFFRVGRNNYRLAKKGIKTNAFSNVAIAAYVTAYARIHMHKFFMEAPDEVYYTDTDSIYSTHAYKTGSGLGELKLEDKVYSACFLLPKTYIAGNKIVMKGFDKKKTKDFQMEDFEACLEGDLKRLSIVNEPKFATLKTALRQKEIVTMTKESPRQIRSRYDKRIIIKRSKYEWDTQAIELPIRKESQERI